MGFIQNVKEEINIIRERDPAIHSNWEVFLYPSFKAVMMYRTAHKWYVNGHYFWARWLSQKAVRKTGIEIHPGAQIGKGLFIDHGSGVIIGETTIIGDNCTLYQGVTLGGTGKEQGKRHPTLGNNVMVSAGAKVLGSFTIGDNCKIGAGSVVLEEVPPNCTVVGIPGRIVKRVKTDMPQELLDHNDLPDPIQEEIGCLELNEAELGNRVDSLEQEIEQLKTLLAVTAGANVN
ncbi:MAG: serine O-acetyltransferase [Agathobacter sp.]|nr:serine O-acetyltransferase [Agathobacter sp.]